MRKTSRQKTEVRNASLSEIGFEDNAVIVIQLKPNENYDGRETPWYFSPQQDLINHNGEVLRHLRLSRGLDSKKWFLRDSKSSKKIYVYIKIDGEHADYESLLEVSKALLEEDVSGRPLYYEDFPGDDLNLAMDILKKSGADIVCCKKSDEPSVKKKRKRGRFEIKFNGNTLYKYLSKRIRGLESELKNVAFYVMRLIEAAAYEKDEKIINWALVGPSGTGKSELIEAIQDFFKLMKIPIPVFRVDLSQFTEVGYKGRDIGEIIKQLSKANSSTCPGFAICFFDEADKKLLMSGSDDHRDFYRAFQSNLLTVVEGSDCTYETRDGDTYEYNTEKVMFVFVGSFQQVRDRKMKKMKNLDFEECSDTERVIYDSISLDDMKEYGMSTELAGRIGNVINLKRIPESMMRELLADKIKETADEIGILIEYPDSLIDMLIAESYGNEGIRRPVNIIKGLIYDAITDKYLEGKVNRRTRVYIEDLDKAYIVENKRQSKEVNNIN